LGLRLHYLDVRGPHDIESAFREAGKEHVDAVLVLATAVLSAQRRAIVDLALKRRLPAMYPRKEDTEAGGLISYGPNLTDMWRRAAAYVDN